MRTEVTQHKEREVSKVERVKTEEDYLFNQYKIYIPKSLMDPLKDFAKGMCLPVSRLICYAIDNELEASIPFNYPCKLPESVYIRGTYSDEAMRVTDLMRKFTQGAGKDMIMMHRRAMGIPNRETLMLALREMLESGVVEETVPPAKAKFKGYSHDYKYIRFRKLDASTLTGKQKKILQDIARLEAQLHEGDTK